MNVCRDKYIYKINIFVSRNKHVIIMGRTCGLLIIGDEILKGQIPDTNSFFLCKRLFQLGVSVNKVVVLPDDVDVLANEVNYKL